MLYTKRLRTCGVFLKSLSLRSRSPTGEAIQNQITLKTESRKIRFFLVKNFKKFYEIMTRTTLILRYLLFINIFTFIVRWIDKSKARGQKRRISEKNLLRFTGLGWRIGAVLGMQAFHHKTIKSWFLTKFRLITWLRILLTITLLYIVW